MLLFDVKCNTGEEKFQYCHLRQGHTDALNQQWSCHRPLFLQQKKKLEDLVETKGPFLEVREKFMHPQSNSKISKQIVAELFSSNVCNINRGSLKACFH